jgi:eukaryotic-like serine/threonine-protein kinase
MTTDHDRIEAILVQALEIHSDSERRKYVEKECGTDRNLRIQVEELLHYCLLTGGLLSRDDSEVVPTRPDQDHQGERIGPYRLLEKIGEGGMGVVYLAEQSEPVQRQVAVKVIRLGMDSEQVIARFEQERQSLALMNHPNIARVFDGGVTSDGRPYFAMELVLGEPITRYCDDHRLPIEDRIELFVQVCQAVHHSHQKGIVHRDIKPSNVLITQVDERPIPKVIDFGVAKAIGQGSMFTEIGQIIGTLEYMSPEQAELGNQDVDTRADIYTLGVLLYELLTGSPPFSSVELRRVGLGEMVRIIKEVEPSKPSTKITTSESSPTIAGRRRLDPQRLVRHISGDLDCITMKCLEKQRSHRYETVTALAQDLERFLEGRPVLACPPSVRYRLGKFARKYRTILSLATSLGILLVVATGVSIVQAFHAHALHRESQSNLNVAQGNLRLAMNAVDQFCTKVSEDLRMKEQDLRPLRKELLSSAVDFHQQLLERRNDTGLAKLELARAYGRLGELCSAIDGYRPAARHFETALAELESLPSEQRTTPDIQREIARYCASLAKALKYTTNSAEANAMAERSTEIYERLLEQDLDTADLRKELAQTRMLQSSIAYIVNDIERTKQLIQQSLEIWGRLIDDYPNDPEFMIQRATCHSILGKSMTSKSLSGWREAEREFDEACEWARRANGLPGTVRLSQNVLANALWELGRIAKYTGRSEKAVEYLTEAASIYEAARQWEPSVLSHAHELAKCYTELAYVRMLQNDDDAAKSYLLQGEALLRPLVRSNAGDTNFEVTFSDALSKLGAISLKGGDAVEALSRLDEAVRLVEGILQREPTSRVRTESAPFTWRGRGRALLALDRPHEAMRDFETAMQNANPGFRGELQMERLSVFIEMGQYRTVIPELKIAIDELTAHVPSHSMGYQYMRSAKILAKCGIKANQDISLESSDRSEISEDCYGEAVRMLQQCREYGWKEFETLSTSPDLEPLSNRTDFKSLFR